MFGFFRKAEPKVRIEPTLEQYEYTKSIAFIDADQGVGDTIHAYEKYIKGKTSEVHLIRACTEEFMPKKLKNLKDVNVIALPGMSPKKEVTDKFIAAFIQKAIADRYNDITVVSSDYDFIDIFKMAAKLSDTSKIKFNLIAMRATGKLAEAQVAGVNIIKG